MSENKNENRNTVLVNAFGGPGAGKTTCAWEIASKLKKQGLCVEYVSEYAKELVWDGQMDLLDGSLQHQSILLGEQKKREDRLIGKVDVIVTDSPLLLNILYCNDCPDSYKKEVLELFHARENFNFFVERDLNQEFEQRGRIQDLSQSQQKDQELKNFLEQNDIYYGTYSHERVGTLTNNIVRTFHRLNEAEQDYGWKGTPFQEYIEDYVGGCLDRQEGKETNFLDLQYDITEMAWRDMPDAGKEEAKAFIQEYFEDANKTHEWMKQFEEESVLKASPFETPELYRGCMLQKGIEELFEESGLLEEPAEDLAENFTLDQETIQDLKESLGIGSRNREKTAFLAMEPDLEVE